MADPGTQGLLLQVLARQTLMEMLVSDLLLNAFHGSPDPRGNLAAFREQSLQKLKYRSQLPPTATEADANLAMAAISAASGFAERFFDGLGEDLDRILPD